MKKILFSSILLFIFLALGSHVVYAQTQTGPSQATAGQGFIAAQEQSGKDAEAITQDLAKYNDLLGNDPAGAQLAADEAKEASADLVLQQDDMVLDTSRMQGNVSAPTLAAQQAQVEAAGANMWNAKVQVDNDNGDTAAATADAATARLDATAANQNAVAAGGTAAQPGAATVAATGGTGNFIALTNLPVLSGLTSAPSLPFFFNQLYKYCVGIAAILAILQITRAGIIYMGGDSVTETKHARALIFSSILGLVLVLSPVLIFGIINPNILNLNVGFSALTPTTPAAGPTSGAPQTSAQAQTTAVQSFLGSNTSLLIQPPAPCPTTGDMSSCFSQSNPNLDYQQTTPQNLGTLYNSQPQSGFSNANLSGHPGLQLSPLGAN